MKPAILLDRDGVIIENRSDYVRKISEVVFIPGALNAISKINKNKYLVIIVTNQSVVGRGLITLQVAEQINSFVVDKIRQNGGHIDAVLMCPHEPLANCDCRKPQPGLLLNAAKQFEIDLASSIMIGDAVTDILAGKQAKVNITALVETGRGMAQKQILAEKNIDEVHIFASLTDALSRLDLIR